MCLMGQVKAYKQEEVFSDLVVANKTSGEPTDEDIKTGYELYHAVVFCPTMVFKVYDFIDEKLANETSRTIIHTIVHLLESSAITAKSFILAKQFYHVLAATLDLQYGDILLATSTNAQREIVLRKGLPFFSKPHRFK